MPSGNIAGQPMGSPQAQHQSYRPFTILTFRMNVNFHGFEVEGFHAVNMLLHGIASVLFTMACELICAKASQVGIGWMSDSCQGSIALPPSLSTLAGIIFAIHPVHTEAVSNIVCRAGKKGGKDLFSGFSLIFRASFVHFLSFGLLCVCASMYL